jgi:chorismate lyase/3-hydroxybenzoate synthase
MAVEPAPLSRRKAASALSLHVSFDAMANPAAHGNLLGAVWHSELPVKDGIDINITMPPLLATHAGMLEQWRVDAEVRSGQRGPAHYRYTDRLLFVTITIGEPVSEYANDIEGAARQAYAALFDVMEAEGFAYLVRCWNYFADINADQPDQRGVLERYRLFNIGRQAAFEAAEHSAEVGAPAACALGTSDGPLTIYALAARSEPSCVENPRQVSAYRYPQRYGPKSPSFSRGSVLSDGNGGHVLFVSGTASILGHESVHLGDVVAQTEESLRNIATVVAQANLGLGAEVFSSRKLCYKVFVRNVEDAAVVADTLRRIVGSGAGTESGETADMVVLRADVCRAELLVEIEAVGFA